MKKKPLFLVTFLIMSLCMIPSVTAEYGDWAPQSITIFSETLPADVLHFPDTFHNSTPHIGDSGDSEYYNSHVLDTTFWRVTGSNPEEINFVFSDPNVTVEGFTYACYAYYEGSEYGELQYYNGSSWLIVESVENNYPAEWYNDTVYISELDTKNIITLRIVSTGISDISVDYLEVQWHYLTLTDDNHYGEGFTDVSDWFEKTYSGTVDGDCDITTDGDIVTFSVDLNDAGSEYCVFASDNFSSPLPAESYFEIRLQINGKARIYIRIHDLDGTVNIVTAWRGEGVDIWQTYKVYLGNLAGLTGDIYSLSFIVDDYSNSYDSDTAILYVDYIGIFPSNETGLQHDGSTTEGISNEGSANWNFGTSSDGDVLSLTWERESTASDTAAWQEISLDSTSTSAELDLDYYPFWVLQWRVTESTNASISNLQVYTDDTRLALVSITAVDETTIWSTMRYNMRASTDTGIGGNSIRFYCGNSEDTATLTLEIEFTGFYSIANFTYDDGGGESTNDYSYVKDGNLVVHTDTYTKWNHDPALSVPIDSYNVWEASLESGDEYFRFRELGDTNTLWNQGVTKGELVGTTFTDFDILIYGNCEISAIKFLDDHTWRGITVTVWFEVPAFVGSLNMLLIFGGLILIPASTLYAVKGGRDEMSSDKLFYFLIAFIMGWALVIGGIYA